MVVSYSVSHYRHQQHGLLQLRSFRPGGRSITVYTSQLLPRTIQLVGGVRSTYGDVR